MGMNAMRVSSLGISVPEHLETVDPYTEFSRVTYRVSSLARLFLAPRDIVYKRSWRYGAPCICYPRQGCWPDLACRHEHGSTSLCPPAVPQGAREASCKRPCPPLQAAMCTVPIHRGTAGVQERG